MPSSSDDDDVPLAAKVKEGKQRMSSAVAEVEAQRARAGEGGDPVSVRNGPVMENGHPQHSAKASGDAHRGSSSTGAVEREGSPKKRKKVELPPAIVDDQSLNAKRKKIKAEHNGSAPPTSPPARNVKTERGDASGKKVGEAKRGVAKDGSVKREKKERVKKEEEEEDEPEYKWWENLEEGPKWTTLEHSGVLFPPPYEPLPSHVQMRYDGQPVALPPDAEEVAGFFGALLESDHASKPTFVKNFFEDFQSVIKSSGGARSASTNEPIKIKKFDKCDFRPLWEYFEKKKEEKKTLSKEQKKSMKEEKDKLEANFTYCLLDGRKEKVGNFRIEPPGLFRGRGDHPKTGRLKQRVESEQITINIGSEAVVPKPPTGHSWQKVQHDNEVTWLATWKENINGSTKYVFLAANSSLKGQSDYKKFEKARELQKHIEKIRKTYTKELRDDLMLKRQRATAMYLIDVFALRAGGEKGDDEADTVGCCSLRFEHVVLQPPNTVIFDFLGKDSIRYYNEVQVAPQVFKNLKIFKKAPKTKGDLLFDQLSVPAVNKYLQDWMPGLTAKVFRTYNASYTMQQELDKLGNVGTVADKLLAYNRANRAVAILCNHQRSVSKAHGSTMERMGFKILEQKYQKLRLKRQIRNLDGKRFKHDPEYFEPDSDLDEDTIAEVQKRILEKLEDSIRKKFEKDNAKLLEGKEKPMNDSELTTRLEAVKELGKEYKAENKSGLVETKSSATVEKLEDQIGKLQERILSTKSQQTDRDEGKAIALGTSKLVRPQ